MNLDSAVFYTNNIDKAIQFFRDQLEFQVEYIQENRFVSFIFPNGAKLGIRQKNPSEDREVPGNQSVFVSVDDAKSLASQLKAKGIELYREISFLDGWGTNFQILDQDGNKIAFVEHEETK